MFSSWNYYLAMVLFVGEFIFDQKYPAESNRSLHLSVEIILTVCSISLFFLLAISNLPTSISTIPGSLLALLKTTCWLVTRQIIILLPRGSRLGRPHVDLFDGMYNGEYAAFAGSYLLGIHAEANLPARESREQQLKGENDKLKDELHSKDAELTRQREEMSACYLRGVRGHTELLRVVVPAWNKTMADNQKLRRKAGLMVIKSEKVWRLLARSLDTAEETLQRLEKEEGC